VALSLTQTAALVHVLKPFMRVASMGYPDIIAEIGDMPGLEYRADSEAICKRHGLRPRRIPDAHSFFALRSCKLDVYDVVQERGCEILCDLNYPFEAGQYDIVLDVGTAEHCFNIAQAMMNMAGLVKVGGVIIHENPFLAGNHGFYSLNPTFYADFYAANGFELLECKLAARDGGTAEVSHTKRFRFEGAECNVFAMARRTTLQEFVFPVQSKYKGLIPEKNNG
jgi:SAM-dependent methyltransferase